MSTKYPCEVLHIFEPTLARFLLDEDRITGWWFGMSLLVVPDNGIIGPYYNHLCEGLAGNDE